MLFFEHIRFQPYLFLVGAALLGLGIWLFRQQVAFLSTTRKAYGRLVDWGENVDPIPNSGSPKVHYYAHVVFEAADGSEHYVTSATGQWPKPSTPIGHIYPVRYDPDNPDDARLDTLFDYWGPSVLILCFGAFTLFVAFHVAAR